MIQFRKYMDWERFPLIREVELSEYEKKIKQRTSGPSVIKRQLSRKKRR